MNKKRLLSILKLIFGLSILLMLFLKFKPDNLSNIFISVKLYYIPFVIIILNFATLIISINLKMLFTVLKKKITIFRIFKYSLFSNVIGAILPSKLGELSIIYFLVKKEDFSAGNTTAVIFLDKIISLGIMIFIGICGLYHVFYFKYAILTLVISFLVFLLFLFVLFSDKSKKFIKKHILRKYENYFNDFSNTIFYYLRKYKKLLLIDALLTIVKLIIGAYAVKLVFMAFNYDVNIFQILLINSAATITVLMPFSIHGLGLKEASAVFLYNKINVDPAITINVYLTILSLYWLENIIIALLMSHGLLKDVYKFKKEHIF